MRHFNRLDTILGEIDTMLRTLAPPKHRASQRPLPGAECADPILTPAQKKHIAGLMRVNHAGEVCAQALYQGQALTAHLTHIKEQMANAAAEEEDHLAWCEQRLSELNSNTGLLNPLWYLGSLMIGALAGFAGDAISLGFVAETEKQVSQHLQTHLNNLPDNDLKTRAILEQMHEDETHHADMAKQAGAIELPKIIQQLMTHVAKIMTKTSYYF